MPILGVENAQTWGRECPFSHSKCPFAKRSVFIPITINKKSGTDLRRQVPLKKTLENDKYRLKLLVIECKVTKQIRIFQDYSTDFLLNNVKTILNFH